MEATSKVQQARTERRRRRQIIAVGFLLLMGLVAFLYPHGASSDDRLDTTPGFEGAERSIDTRPFERAQGESSGATTLPPSALDPRQTTTAPPTTAPPPSTTTTIAIPAAPTDDPICAMATTVISALRILTGPDGSSPDNLRAGSLEFAQAADVLEASGRSDIGPLLALTRKIAIELPSATNDAEAAAIYNQLLAPSDPAILPVASRFGQHLQTTCPALLTLEP